MIKIGMFCYVAIACMDTNVLWFFKPQGYSHVAIVMCTAYNFIFWPMVR